MIYEIGAYLHKGEGHRLVEHFRGDKRVLGVYVEQGRTDTLFRFREFGSASENDIVTMIVKQESADAVFKAVHKLVDMERPQSGILFQMPLHKRIAGV